MDILQSLPLLITLISFVCNSIPYISIPYLLILLTYITSTSPPIFESIYLTILSALGASLGKIIIYYIGKGIGKLVIKDIDREKIQLFNKIASKGIFIAILIFAATPLPDDVIYIPIGLLGYNIVKFFIACFIGKTFITGIVVLFGDVLVYTFKGFEINWISTVIAIIISIMIILLIRKIDWSKLVTTLSENGVRYTIQDILKNPKQYIH